jgi:hypothetical protein
VKRQNLSNAVVSSVSGLGGDIRRTEHGTMLVAAPALLYTDEAFPTGTKTMIMLR